MGKQLPLQGNYGTESFNGGGDTFTLSRTATAETILVFIEGVRQTPTDAYTVSGTTLTTTATTPSGTDNVTVQFLGDVVDFGEPGDDTVTSAKIVDGAIVNADVNASAAVDVSKLNISGSATSANFLRGDSSWQPLTEYDDSGVQDDIALLGFKVAANGSLAKYNLVDQTVDDFQDTSGVDASASTNEVRDSIGKYYAGGSSTTPTASGGTITTDGDYTVHKFTADGTFTTDTAQTVEYLVVAGGGGGGSCTSSTTVASGGGGAGEFAEGSLAVTATSYSITVGDGGAEGGVGAAGSQGGDSVFSTVTSDGGGGGGQNGSAGGSGGSGGGAGTDGSAGAATASGTGRYGFAGGSSGSGAVAAGGGGAGAVGGSITSSNDNGGAGGSGRESDILISGTNVYYAGGGGGGVDPNYPGANGTGGTGGGAEGGSGAQPADATANTGGGGGGNGNPSNVGSAGGSGLVVIRRPTSEDTSGIDMTLVSTTTAAQSAPTKGDIVLTYTNGAGTTTLDTDLTAEISADGGSTWTELALGSEGSTGSHNIATSHDVTITSTITAPYNMAYRIKTLNQSVSKTTRIQAVSLGWS